MKEIDIIVTYSGYIPDNVSISEIEDRIEREISDSVFLGCIDEEEGDCYADRRQTLVTEKGFSIMIG